MAAVVGTTPTPRLASSRPACVDDGWAPWKGWPGCQGDGFARVGGIFQAGDGP
jgi:hypothetical protein